MTIVIAAGTQGALDLLARLLLNPGDEVWLEEPGYLGARGALHGAGAWILPVPVDREGLMVREGIARAPRRAGRCQKGTLSPEASVSSIVAIDDHTDASQVAAKSGTTI